jgi:hypothetical protein
MRVRKNRDPRQLTFNFDVMADQMVRLRLESSKPGAAVQAVPAAAPETAPPARAGISAQAASNGVNPIIWDIINISDGTLSHLLGKEGYAINKYENLSIVREAWINSQKTSPDFDSWNFAWNYFARTGQFKNVAGSIAAKEKPLAGQDDAYLSRTFGAVGMERHPTQEGHYTWRNFANRQDVRVSAVLMYDGKMQNGKAVPWEVYCLAPIGSFTDVPPKRFVTAEDAANHAATLIDKFKRELSVSESTGLAEAKSVTSSQRTDSALLQETTLKTSQEALNDRRTDEPAGYSQASAQAGNYSGGHKETRTSGFQGAGPVGAEQPGRTEGIGSAGGGGVHLLWDVSEQAAREAQVLNSDSGWEMHKRGMSDWEILEAFGIDTELRITE